MHVIAYRYRTPHRLAGARSKPDEVINLSLSKPGVTVWVEGPNGREEYITVEGGSCIPGDEYRRRKEEKKQKNLERERTRPRISRSHIPSRRRRDWTHGHGLTW